MHTMVVQLGLATIPFGMEARVSTLTSGTTRGTSGSMRHAEELSTTIAPAAATLGANSRDVDAPFENRAISIPSKESDGAPESSTTTSAPSVPQGRRRPAERDDA